MKKGIVLLITVLASVVVFAQGEAKAKKLLDEVSKNMNT